MLSFTTSLSDSFNEYNQIQDQRGKEEERDETSKQTNILSLWKLNELLKKVTVEPVTFCYACALILHAPLIQQYIYHVTSVSYGLPSCIKDDVSSCDASQKETIDSPSYLLRKDVQSRTSYIYLGIILSASIPSLVMALLLGSWSDIAGRKIVILLPVLGGLLDTICILVTMATGAPLYVLFIGSFMNGVCGFFTTMILAVFSYIADITHENERALRLGILEAVAFTSGMISHVTSGWWIRHLGFKAPYIFILCLHITSLIYIIFYLPETGKQKGDAILKDLFAWKHFQKVIVIFRPTSRHNMYQLVGLTITSSFMMVSNIGFGSVIVLYALDTPFCLSPIMIGYFLADCMLMQALGALFALVVLQKCLSEILLIQLGMVSIITSLIMMALITNRWQMFLVPVAGLFGGVCMPVIRAKMSKLVEADNQGSLFAAVATLETLCTLFGAAIFNSLYPYTVKELNFKGFSFLIMAALFIVPAIIISLIGILPEQKNEDISKSKLEEK